MLRASTWRRRIEDWRKRSFFTETSGIEDYLNNYKLGGDLLQALHMTSEEDGTFLFRSRFETTDKYVYITRCVLACLVEVLTTRLSRIIQSVKTVGALPTYTF